jgi:hypothetical protein
MEAGKCAEVKSTCRIGRNSTRVYSIISTNEEKSYFELVLIKMCC